MKGFEVTFEVTSPKYVKDEPSHLMTCDWCDSTEFAELGISDSDGTPMYVCKNCLKDLIEWLSLMLKIWPCKATIEKIGTRDMIRLSD